MGLAVDACLRDGSTRQLARTEQLENGQVWETQDILLVIYQVGAFRVPPVSVHFVNAEGDSGKIASQSIDVALSYSANLHVVHEVSKANKTHTHQKCPSCTMLMSYFGCFFL